MARISQQEAIPQDALAILKNVLKELYSPSIEVMQEICYETGLSFETINSWFANNSKQNDKNMSAPQQEILESYLEKTHFVTKKLSLKIAKETSLKPKTVLHWFIGQECTYLKDNQIQMLQTSFDRSPFLTKTIANRLSKKTKLTPKTICKWFVEEYKFFNNELNSLSEPNSENKTSCAITQEGALRCAKKNGQWSIYNGSQWRTVCRVANCKKEKQSHQLCQKHFMIGSKVLYFIQQIDKGCNVKQKLMFESKIQKLLIKSGHVNN